jgi:hypothetical protein
VACAVVTVTLPEATVICTPAPVVTMPAVTARVISGVPWAATAQPEITPTPLVPPASTEKSIGSGFACSG